LLVVVDGSNLTYKLFFFFFLLRWTACRVTVVSTTKGLTMKTARIVRNVSAENGARGVQLLIRLSPPFEGHEFVVASSVDVVPSGFETLIFSSSSTGQVANYMSIGGGRGLTVADVFTEAGYHFVEVW
jgi:hypothetical protein